MFGLNPLHVAKPFLGSAGRHATDTCIAKRGLYCLRTYMAQSGNEPLQDYVIMPRQIARDYRNGILRRADREVYVWMRINANPYGIAVVTLDSIAQDVFGGSKTKNYVNQILLKLKKQKYIFYEQRAGQRGSFEVHFGDWLLPGKDESGKTRVKSLAQYFEKAKARRKKLELINPKTENYTEVGEDFQRSDEQNTLANEGQGAHSPTEQNRGPDNDTDTETENEKNHGRLPSVNRDLSIEGFSARSHEEEICHVIAKEIGEEDMRFIIGSLKKYGIQVIEAAYIRLQRALKKGGVDNPRKLFNHIVQREAGLTPYED